MCHNLMIINFVSDVIPMAVTSPIIFSISNITFFDYYALLRRFCSELHPFFNNCADLRLNSRYVCKLCTGCPVMKITIWSKKIVWSWCWNCQDWRQKYRIGRTKPIRDVDFLDHARNFQRMKCLSVGGGKQQYYTGCCIKVTAWFKKDELRMNSCTFNWIPNNLIWNPTTLVLTFSSNGAVVFCNLTPCSYTDCSRF